MNKINSQKLKIVHALAYYGNYLGGLQTYVKEIATRQKKQHDVKILTSDLYGKDKIVDGIPLIKTPVLFSFFRIPFTPFLPKKLLDQNCDILHVHLPLPWLDICAVFKKTIHPKTRLIVTIHNDIAINSLLSNVLAFFHNKILINLVINKADKIITTSKEFYKSLPYNIPLNKLSVVQLGVDTKMFYPNDTFNKNKILFVGRLIPEKGLHILVSAMEKVIKEIPETELNIISSNTYNYKKYEKKILGKNIPNIKIFKNIPYKEMRSFYADATVTVMPSLYSESFGFVQLESMACGCPVIVSDLPGLNSIVTKDTGLIVEQGNVDELANAIIKILKSKSISRSKIRKSTVSNYSWEKVYPKLISAYNI